MESIDVIEFAQFIHFVQPVHILQFFQFECRKLLILIALNGFY